MWQYSHIGMYCQERLFLSAWLQLFDIQEKVIYQLDTIILDSQIRKHAPFFDTGRTVKASVYDAK